MDRDLSPGLSDIVTIENPGSRDVVIRLRERSNFLLDDLTVAIAKSDANGAQVGTGPFVTTSVEGTEVVMVAVERYYRGRPQIDRIVWKAYPAVRAAWAALMRGELDFLYEVGPEAVEFVEGESSIEVFPFLRSYLYGIIFNSKRLILSEPEIRRALSYAINRQSFVHQALKGHGRAAPNAAWLQHWAYDNAVPEYSYDPNRAVALLDRAGMVLRTGKAPDERASRLQFTCLVPEGFDLWERMALLVQRDLSEIRVDMKLESLPFEAFNQRITNGDFDAVALEFVAGNGPSRPYTFWHSRSRRNAWGYRNQDLDKALDDLRHASNESNYRDAFRRFQLESLEDPPAILLGLGETTRAVSKRFDVVAPPGSDILPTISDWRPADPGKPPN